MTVDPSVGPLETGQGSDVLLADEAKKRLYRCAVVLLGGGLALLLALLPLLPRYCELLQFVVVGAALYAGYALLLCRNLMWLALLPVVVVLNPFAPVYLGRALWIILDPLAAMVLFSIAWFCRDLGLEIGSLARQGQAWRKSATSLVTSMGLLVGVPTLLVVGALFLREQSTSEPTAELLSQAVTELWPPRPSGASAALPSNLSRKPDPPMPGAYGSTLPPAPHHPDLSSLSPDEEMSILAVCTDAFSRGPAAYDACLVEQLHTLGRE